MVTANSSVTRVVQKTCLMTVIAEHVCIWACAMCVHTGVYDACVYRPPFGHMFSALTLDLLYTTITCSYVLNPFIS